MKYILTGGSGFIGSHFSEVLGNDIILNIDINKPSNESKNYLKLDILNFDKLLNIPFSCNEDLTLIHLAAVHFDFQKNFYDTNVNGTKNILEFVSKNNIKNFVFFSSVAVYGPSHNGKTEISDKNPTNDYGKSKLLAENIILDWSKSHPEVKIIIVRPAVVFGEFNFGNVFNLIQQIKSGYFAIIGKGNNIKSIAYVKNLVYSVLFCLGNNKLDNFIYNYCDYPQYTIAEQSNLISKILLKRKPIKIPLILTKIITVPIDLLQLLLKKDLKINSMRVKKFTESTFFNSDKIRRVGFKQKIEINDSYNLTKNWINSVDIEILRSNWYNKASKL